MAIDEVEVLIVGGGPVGLTARALLERWGVRAMLVEKYVELSFRRSGIGGVCGGANRRYLVGGDLAAAIVDEP
ncbi:MAG TPA: FAD-dependent monooxygenase, partial [Mycobacterium sp.]|nr:FAD-dependent monooxygenase [Mycobacterium sp.]